MPTHSLRRPLASVPSNLIINLLISVIFHSRLRLLLHLTKWDKLDWHEAQFVIGISFFQLIASSLRSKLEHNFLGAFHKPGKKPLWRLLFKLAFNLDQRFMSDGILKRFLSPDWPRFSMIFCKNYYPVVGVRVAKINDAKLPLQFVLFLGEQRSVSLE